MLPLQIPKRASKLAVTNIVTTGEHCLQGCQERRSLVPLQRTDGMGNGQFLGVSEDHLVGPVAWRFRIYKSISL